MFFYFSVHLECFPLTKATLLVPFISSTYNRIMIMIMTVILYLRPPAGTAQS